MNEQNRAKCFAEVLCEELWEITRLRRLRRPSMIVGEPDPACADPGVHPNAGDVPPNDPSQKVFHAAHAKKLVGLAFSGGGIRSATFNLGILQGLAEAKLLCHFDYLSTVSGGGYIGGWLTAWIKRRGFPAVQDGLQPDRSAQTAPNASKERPEISFLRDYSNYLTPRLGFLGADTWTAIAVYLRNLLLNQAVLVMALSVFLLLPRVLAHLVVKLGPWITLRDSPGLWIAGALWLLSILGAAINMKVLAYRGPDKVPAKWSFVTTQGGIIAFSVIPSFIAAWLLCCWLWANSHSLLNVFCSWPAGTPSLFNFCLPWMIWGMGMNLALWTVAFVAARMGNIAARIHNFYFSLFIAHVAAILAGGALSGVLLRVVTRIMDRWHAPSGIWHMMSWGLPLVLVALLLSRALYLGVLGTKLADERREWWARESGFVMIMGLLWMALFATAIYSPLGVAWARGWISVAGAGWIATTLAGVFRAGSSSAGSPGVKSSKELLLSLTPYVFIVGLLTLIACVLHVILAADWNELTVFLSGSPTIALMGKWLWLVPGKLAFWNSAAPAIPSLPSAPACANYVQCHWQLLNGSLGERLLTALVVCAGLTLLLAWRVDINEFSMHPFYRNRLVRAYLGASRSDRAPNPFTGFDSGDDLGLQDLESAKGFDGLYPILNTTLNLVHGKSLAWQERKAESFIMTPKNCGFDVWLERRDLDMQSLREPKNAGNVWQRALAWLKDAPEPYGFRPTSAYVYPHGGLYLGTAMSISGAALSPNMGFHSSAALSFLLTMFNARLGFWAGNPRRPRQSQQAGPAFGLFRLMAELLGLTDDEARSVYLSDGGHFENLGVYELVKRRCRLILACDAGEDQRIDLTDLAGAIRKCRSDMGVDIRILTDNLQLHPDGRNSTWHCAIGEIRYDTAEPGAQPGVLIYLKSGLTGDEPTDVWNYKTCHKEFPHQTTNNQWFTESQFESYRMLGLHVLRSLLKPFDHPDGLSTEALAAALVQHWSTAKPPAGGEC